MTFTYVTVTRDYDLADGTESAGLVRFTPAVAMVNGGATVVAAPVVARLDVDGHISVSLAANTDATTAPQGNYYTVREEIDGQPIRQYAVIVPHDQGATLDLSSLAQVSSPPSLSFPAATVSTREGPLSLLDPRVDCRLDGTGDEAARVATAISLLPAAGGHIYQPPGTLRTSAISFDRPVRWEGAGDQASTIQAASGFTGTLITITKDATFSRISDVQLGGGGSATKLILVAAARTRLDHLHLTGAAAGSGAAAIHYNGVSTSDSAHASQVSDVRILSCGGYGIYLQGFSYDNEFANLWIGSCNVGIRYENTNGFFTNTHVWGSTGNGIELRDGSHLFSNCYVETNGGSGFNLFNAAQVRIANCNLWKNQGSGVNASGTSHRLSVVGCLIYDNGGNGVTAADCLYGQVIGNTMYDDTGSAQDQDRPVVTTGTSDSWIITGNVIRTADHAVGGNSLVGAANVSANNIT